jgi:hypothetical protein
MAKPTPPPTGGGPLNRLRGNEPRQPYTARKITALTVNPGCERRAVIDGAGVDKLKLARRLGKPAPFNQSPLAITRQRSFAEQLKAYGYAELITLLRGELGVPVVEAGVSDLNSVGGNEDPAPRAAETRNLLRAIAEDREARLILDHPVLALDVAGTTAYLEPDAVSHRIEDKLYVVLIRSFAAVDGQADAGKVAEAAKQAAVYVLALRQTLCSVGVEADLVSDRFLLVLPKDFSNRPYSRLVDLRQQLDAVQYQLTRMASVVAKAAALSPDATLDVSRDADGRPAASAEELLRTVEELPHLYGPRCLGMCELSRYCRDSAVAVGDPAHLGSTIRDSLPGIDSTGAAHALAYGEGHTPPAQEEVAALLRSAADLRTRRLGGGAA